LSIPFDDRLCGRGHQLLGGLCGVPAGQSWVIAERGDVADLAAITRFFPVEVNVYF
jgi:hypothetical protein